MTDCPFCPRGKRTCKHQGPTHAQGHPPADTGRKQIVDPGANSTAPKPGDSLFVLHGKLLDLACVLCDAVIASGRDQPRLRYIHGLEHARLGQARELAVSTVDPFPGSTFVARFEVVGNDAESEVVA